MHSDKKSSDIIYILDRYFNIIYINDAWTDFALQNNGLHLMQENVIGKNLFDFISCPATSNLYKLLINKVKSTKKSISFPFRCDSPDKRRFMKMIINPLEGGGFEFMSVLLSEEKREPVPFNISYLNKNKDLLIVCSWCNKVKVDKKWLEIEDAIAELDLLSLNCSDIPMLSHGMCEFCYNQYVKNI